MEALSQMKLSINRYFYIVKSEYVDLYSLELIESAHNS